MIDRQLVATPGDGRRDPLVSKRSWALLGACVAVLVWLIHDVEQGGGVVGMDHDVTAFVVAHRSPVLDAMATAVTVFGNEVTLTLLTLALVGALWLGHARRRAVLVAVAMAGSAFLTVAGKHLVMRARPPVSDVVGSVLDRSYSFPSGHTLNSAVFVAALLYVAAPAVTAHVARVFLVVMGSLLVFGIGLSRVYLGYHWVSDVLGAWLVATIWMTVLCTGFAAARRHPAAQDVVAPRAGLALTPPRR